MRTRLLTVLFAAALLAGACGDSDDDTGAPDGAADGGGTVGGGEQVAVTGETISIALGSEPTSLDPHLVDDGGERAINDNIYETLLTRDPQGELQPGLATDLPTQLDDTTWQFTLREGVTFHNGEPFNADAVVASVERMMRLVDAEATDLSGLFGTFAGAEAVDDLTVNIRTSSPDGVLPSRMYWLKMVPASTAASDDLTDDPVGTGPYTFVEFVRGDHITIEANPDYWDGPPSVAGVRYSFLEESGARLAGLLAGEYDLITNLQPEDVEAAPQSAEQRAQEHPIIILDATEGITADPRVRQALNLAVDKEALVNDLFGGFASVDACQLLSPSILGFNDGLQPLAYDPDQAKQLIQDAGVAGQAITLVGTSGRWLKDREILEAVGGFWQEAGLTVDVQVLEFGAYLDVLFDRGSRADAIFVSSSNDLLDPDRQLSTYYHQSGVGSSNTDAELAQLIDQARATVDQDQRSTMYQDAVERACDEAYFVFMVNNDDLYGLSERMQWTPRVDSKILIKEMAVTA